MKKRFQAFTSDICSDPDVTVRIRITDAGRSESKTPRETDDCTVRSIGVATGAGYDIAHDYLKSHGRKSRSGFCDWQKFVDRQKEILGCRIVKHSFPARLGEKRMTAEKFVRLFRRGRFIITFADHVAPVVNGVIYDEMDRYLKRVVYSAYEFKKLNGGKFL